MLKPFIAKSDISPKSFVDNPTLFKAAASVVTSVTVSSVISLKDVIEVNNSPAT